MFNQLTSYCHALLLEDNHALDVRLYLSDRLKPETVDKFQLGYYPSIQTIEKAFGIPFLKENGLLFERKVYDDVYGSHKQIVNYFEHYPLTIPFHNQYGDVVALANRTLLSDLARKEQKLSKYKNTIFTKSKYLYGLYQAKETIQAKNQAIIVEGQFDVMASHQAGLTNVVGVGSSNLSLFQLSLLLRYTDNIIMLFDNDEAGQKGMIRARQKYNGYCKLSKMTLPSIYKDLDDYFHSNNINDFYDILTTTTS